ncbi:MAG: hypothetical protein RJA22_3174 [Verrucomicrobiota bacterium]|jgi:hypothetical protein
MTRPDIRGHLRRRPPALPLLALCLGLLAPSILAADTPGWPGTPGAVFALRDASITSPFLAFDPMGSELLAFNCATRGRSLIGRHHELVCAGGSFHAREAGAWIGLQVAKSGAFTLEATLTPAAAAPTAPGVVLAYGDDGGEDAALLQDRTGLSLRLRGMPRIPLFATEAGRKVHVLVACSRENWAAYRDGRPAGSGPLPRAWPAWGKRQLVLGAAWPGTEPWQGRLEAIALFPRVLTAGEAAAEAAAVQALQAGRKPATALRFRGTLLRQAKTSALKEIQPYTRSLTVAEYKVDQVLAGEWKEPTIAVLHWMILDSQRLAIADRQPGTKVDLQVERLEDHPQLESSRRDELADADPAAPLFYCESETAR